MKTHDDLIYAPIAPAPASSRSASVCFEARKAQPNQARESFRVFIAGQNVADYFVDCRFSFYNKRYALVHSGMIQGWETPSQQRAGFAKLFEKWGVNYDAVFHLIPN